MKILHLIQQSQLRGVEIFTAQLGNHLLAMGHEVKIITLFPGNAALPFEGEIIHLQRNSKNRLVDLAGYKKLAEIISEENPAIVQANAGDTLKYAVLSKVLFHWSGKLVYRNASMVSSYITDWRTKIFNRFLYRQVDYILSVTPQSRKDLNQLFPFTENISGVIPVGIEVNRLKTPVEKNRSPVILHVGGFSFEKNHEGLLRIFAKLKLHFPEAELWLIGDGILKKKMEQLATNMKLFPSVKFMGSKPEVRAYMHVADVVVLPSRIEGLPAVLLEAMAEGCAVVAYNVGGISTIVDDKTGRLVPAGNEEKFADAVMEVLTDESLKHTLTEEALKRVLENYDNISIAREFDENYQRLCRAQHI